MNASTDNTKDRPNLIEVVILAGGQGSRMGGADKGLVALKDKTLVEHVAKGIKAQVSLASTNISVSEIKVLCNRNAQQYQNLGFDTFDDKPFPSEGPLCGIAAAVKQCKADYLAILPCDCPFFPNDYLAHLLIGLRENSATVTAVKHNGKPEPLFMLIDTNQALNLDPLIEAGERKVFTWLDNVNATWIDLPSGPHFFANVNTEEQLEGLSSCKSSR